MAADLTPWERLEPHERSDPKALIRAAWDWARAGYPEYARYLQRWADYHDGLRTRPPAPLRPPLS